MVSWKTQLVCAMQIRHTKSRRRLLASTFCLSEYAELGFPVDIVSKSVGLSPEIHSIVKTLFRLKCLKTLGTCINGKRE